MFFLVKSPSSVKFHDFDGSKSPRFFPKSPWSPCFLLVKSLMSLYSTHRFSLSQLGHPGAPCRRHDRPPTCNSGTWTWMKRNWVAPCDLSSIRAQVMGVAKVMVPPNQHSIVGLSNLWGLGDPSWHIGKPKRFSAVLERVGGKRALSRTGQRGYSLPKDGWVRSYEAMHGLWTAVAMFTKDSPSHSHLCRRPSAGKYD